MAQLGSLLWVLCLRNGIPGHLSRGSWKSLLSCSFRLLAGQPCGCRPEVPAPWLSARDCSHLLEAALSSFPGAFSQAFCRPLHNFEAGGRIPYCEFSSPSNMNKSEFKSIGWVQVTPFKSIYMQQYSLDPWETHAKWWESRWFKGYPFFLGFPKSLQFSPNAKMGIEA